MNALPEHRASLQAFGARTHGEARSLSISIETPYSIVTANVAVCFTPASAPAAPEVAVTVTVVVVALVVEELEEPPQPESTPNPARPITSKRSSCRRFRFLNPSKHSAMASVAAGNNGRVSRWRAAAAEPPELTESVVVAVAAAVAVVC